MKNLMGGFLLLIFLAHPARAIKVERLATGTRPGLRGLAATPGATIEVVAEEALVRFSSGVTAAARLAALQSIGGDVIKELPGGGTHVALPAGMGVADGLDLLRTRPGVEEVSPNHVYRPIRVPNDPLVSTQWALNQINAFAGWEYEIGASCKTTVAVVDVGIDGAHSDLTAKLPGIPGAGQHVFCDPGASKLLTTDDLACVNNVPPTAACNHATRVAGVAAAATDNAAGIAGMSWGAQLLSLKVFRDADCPSSDCTDGACGTDDAAVINAIAISTALQNTAKWGKIVLNLSLGAQGATCSTFMANALRAAVAQGIPVVIAAGNDGGEVNAPANCSSHTAVIAGGNGVIPVGATDSSNAIAAFSSRGASLASYGVVAPGSGVLTTTTGGGTASATGTSFSAPHVAGLAALILSAKPAKTPAEVQTIIRGGADSIGVASLGLDAGGRPLGDSAGAGRINAFRAMRLAVKGTLADFAGDQEAIAFPNPFRTSQNAMVSLTIPVSLQGRDAKIKIYTQNGELVKELSGLTWDGKNAGGNPVATGTYVILVKTDKGTTRGRVAVIR